MTVNRQEAVEGNLLAREFATVAAKQIIAAGIPETDNVLDVIDAWRDVEVSQEVTDAASKLFRWAQRQRDPLVSLFSVAFAAGAHTARFVKGGK